MTEMLLIIVNSIHILIYQDFTQTELMRNNCYSNNFGIRRSGATCEHMLFASNWLFISNVRSSEISFSSFLSDWFHWIQKYFNWHQRWTALAEYIRRSDHFMENRWTNVDQVKQSIFYSHKHSLFYVIRKHVNKHQINAFVQSSSLHISWT